MNARILCVDDEEHILAAHRRNLFKYFKIETALGSEAGLQMFSTGDPFAVVVSDLKMPEINGIEFFSRVKAISPDTVRIMLTGYADLQSSIDAINQGNIFRFLTKPCSTEDLVQAIQDGLQQYHLIQAEKELLEHTLKGSVGVLTDILSILDPQSFGRACVLRDNAREIAKAMGLANTWDIEVAAMLCEIGRVTIPANIIVKENASLPLTAVEQDMLSRIPEIGYKLLAKIPRLESVAQTVLYQNKHFDGSGFPYDRKMGTQIPTGSKIIKIVKDFILLELQGTQRDAALSALFFREGAYDPDILDCAVKYFESQGGCDDLVRKSIRSVTISELKVGQRLITDLMTGSGALLITSGNYISESLLARIRNFARVQSIREPIKIEENE